MDWDGSDPLRFLKMMNGENLGAPGHLSMPEVMEPAKVRKLCKARSSAIMANHDRPPLHSRPPRAIHSQTLDQKDEAAAPPDSAGWVARHAHHAPPGLCRLTQGVEAQRDAGTKFRGHFVWPYIN